MARYTPPTRLDILGYALEGAQTRLGTGLGFLTEDDLYTLERDIEWLEEKIKTAKKKLGES